MDLDNVSECAGDHLLVDKTIFDFRPPRRWEMAVFRNVNDQGKAYVKRVVGLPGESVQIRGGDLYIDRSLCRKSLAELKAVRIPVFDQNYQPQPNGWKDRWLVLPASPAAAVMGTELRVDGTAFDRQYQWLEYHHFNLNSKRDQAISDAYSYNGGDFTTEPVHDFMLECDVEVLHGEGWVGLTLTDGVDTMLAELRVGPVRVNGYGTCLGDADGYIRTAPTVFLTPGKTYHIEFAFVDRRATLAIDGILPFTPVDKPEATDRFEVKRPAKVGALGVEAVFRNFRLFRDIHYTQAGQNGIAKPYRLQGGEYFVLGDNSPNSDDSRFWPDPAVRDAHFLGKPFLVHLPTQNVREEVLGQPWLLRVPDWGRMRWLH
jgi:signal peptidase I